MRVRTRISNRPEFNMIDWLSLKMALVFLNKFQLWGPCRAVTGIRHHCSSTLCKNSPNPHYGQWGERHKYDDGPTSCYSLSNFFEYNSNVDRYAHRQREGERERERAYNVIYLNLLGNGKKKKKRLCVADFALTTATWRVCCAREKREPLTDGSICYRYSSRLLFFVVVVVQDPNSGPEMKGTKMFFFFFKSNQSLHRNLTRKRNLKYVWFKFNLEIYKWQQHKCVPDVPLFSLETPPPQKKQNTFKGGWNLEHTQTQIPIDKIYKRRKVAAAVDGPPVPFGQPIHTAPSSLPPQTKQKNAPASIVSLFFYPEYIRTSFGNLIWGIDWWNGVILTPSFFVFKKTKQKWCHFLLVSINQICIGYQDTDMTQ